MSSDQSAEDSLLYVDGIRKGFPGVQALDGVGFTLDRGEVLALVGENGAGKSTLMKILSGIYSRDEGSIIIDGRAVDITGPKMAQELGISIIHQEMNLMPHLTVAQNIYIGREPRIGPFLDQGRLVRQTRALLEHTGINLNPRAEVGNLTVAQQQMVEIAKALSFDTTKILIMDEPTSAISQAETEVLFALIAELKSRGVGIVYISHRMEELRQIADRVTVLRDGQYVDTRAMNDVTDREIISMMVGRELKGEARPSSIPDTSPDDLALEVVGLSTADLLQDVSFELRRGEMLGFAGLMGAGRTETARAIIGADRRTAGRIMINGRPVAISSPAVAVRHGIGYLPEDRKRQGLMLEQDVNFNTMLASMKRYTTAGFVNQAPARRDTLKYVESLRIKTPSINQLAKNLSGGNQQKIVIAKWLSRNCDILIFDEPTRGIDVGAKEEIYKLLNSLVADGKSIIMISSELPEVLRLSHRIVVMSQGRITGVLDNAEADQESIMDLATQNVNRSVNA
ncbi:sugar ABC transporter ATP-binding protein [Propionibacteriaceae bacterium Y1685]|uniref:sugar ABC transporter ATP-binding protein n=1 Tax=Microlunatus sp. Y1700 TaxID=3418487 RepID=UPI003B80A768